MNRKLFINIIDYYDDIDEMLKTIKKVGFDGVNFFHGKREMIIYF